MKKNDREAFQALDFASKLSSSSFWRSSNRLRALFQDINQRLNPETATQPQQPKAQSQSTTSVPQQPTSAQPANAVQQQTQSQTPAANKPQNQQFQPFVIPTSPTDLQTTIQQQVQQWRDMATKETEEANAIGERGAGALTRLLQNGQNTA